ncbi:hypothetical protein FNV43_RR24931 [Rhamnella rubrinervis]|uniref:Uncharacterized protein n=1 Tax=Rhamnella rubrinervis TaxID=2594499 RepID=A0A8K0GR59_9ROSA|nr:hypothetical protein FNV43_RR24931 [Rhamnella rubrinervis]
MENGKQVTKKAEVVRIPPPRGRIKAKIFKDLAKQVKIIATLVSGLCRKEQRNGGGSSSSASITPLPSNYSSRGVTRVPEPRSQNRP